MRILTLFFLLISVSLMAQIPAPPPPSRDVCLAAIKAHQRAETKRQYPANLNFEKLKGHYNRSKKCFEPNDKSYQVNAFSNGIAVVSRNGFFGIIDTAGNLVRPVDQAIRMLEGTEIGYLEFQKPEWLNDSPDYDSYMYEIRPRPCYGTGTYLLVNRKGELLVSNEVLCQFSSQGPSGSVYYERGDEERYWRLHDRTPAGGYFRFRAWPAGAGVCVLNSKGKEIIPFGRYLSIGDFYEGLAVVCDSMGCGYADTSGKEILPCKFDGAASFSEGKALVRTGEQYSFIDHEGKLLLPSVFAYASGFEDGKVKACIRSEGKNRYWMNGEIDTLGRVVLPFTISHHQGYEYRNESYRGPMLYQEILKLSSDSMPVARIAGYDLVQPLVDGRRLVMKNGKWGYLDKDGKEVIPCVYDMAGFFIEGRARVLQNGYWGFINTKGETVIPLHYDFVFDFTQGTALVQNNRGRALIDADGKYIIPFAEGRSLEKMPSGFIRSSCFQGYSSSHGWFNSRGKELLPCKYESLYDFEGKISIVLPGSKQTGGWVDTSGNAGLNYETASEFREGMARVSRNGKFGFIDSTGKESIPCTWDMVNYFEQGFAVVTKNGKRGFIDKRGKEITPQVYDVLTNFSNGFAPVSKGQAWGMIDCKGHEVIPCSYERVFSVYDGMVMIRRNNKMGYADTKGNLVIEPRFDDAQGFSNGQASVRIGSRWFKIDKSGKEIH